MKTKLYFAMVAAIVALSSTVSAQIENNLKLSGELQTDQRLLLNDDKDWAWNELRLTLNLDKQISSVYKFHSELWLRNIGEPSVVTSGDLFNKPFVDPYNLEIRDAFVQANGFLLNNLDLIIGRQQIVWGTADRLNPTNNLNPHDLEDILDFGRKRGSDAVSFQYYFKNGYSVQGVFIPSFQPANMPVGLFANVLNPSIDMPQGMVLKSISDTLIMPKNSLKESSAAGFRVKGFARGIDFSLSYAWCYDGLPYSSSNILSPVDVMGGTHIYSHLSFIRNHIVGADFVTSIAGAGLWAEAAAFMPENDIVMTTDLSAFFPASPVPVTQDSVLLKKNKPYLKYVIGGDYFFPDGSYLNFQYLHGFIHERGNKALNDYFFLRYEKNLFNDKIKCVPIGGGFIVTDWKNIEKNYAIVYMPEIVYKVNPNTELSLACSFFDGKGQNLFAGLNKYDMVMFKMKYSF
jgi:hypothetical protein